MINVVFATIRKLSNTYSSIIVLLFFMDTHSRCVWFTTTTNITEDWLQQVDPKNAMSSLCESDRSFLVHLALEMTWFFGEKNDYILIRTLF